LGCHFRAGLTAAEHRSIQTVTGIPASHLPQAIVSLGPPAAATPLAGDANRDSRVDLADYALLSSGWLSSKSQGRYDAAADFDADGLIGVTDLALLAAHWLQTAP